MADVRVCSHGKTSPCDQCAEVKMTALSVSGAIAGAAQAEHRRLKESVIRAAKLWRCTKGGNLARQMLDDAVDLLFSFEQQHKGVLGLSSDTDSQRSIMAPSSKEGHIRAKWTGMTPDGERYTPE